MTTPRDLAARAAGHRFGSEADMNQWLAQQGISDPTERLSYKIELMANGALATDQSYPPGTLATDVARHTPETAPLGPEMRTLFRRAGLDPARSYASGELNDLLDRAGLDAESRMAIKVQLA